MEQTQEEKQLFREARKSYSFSLLNISIYYAISFIVILIVRKFLPEKISGQTELLASYIPSYFVAFPLYLLISGRLPKAPPEKKNLPLVQFPLGFCCCECIAIAGSFIGIIINVFLTLLIGRNTSSTFIMEGVFGNDSALFMFIAIVLAPFVEEMIFRKVLIDRTRKYGDGLAIVMSGLMFGLFHANLTQLFYAAGVGMLFGFIYVRTGKAQYNVLMHMLMNFWGTFMPRLLLRNVDMTALLNALQSQDAEKIMEIAPSLSPLLILGAINFTMAAIGLTVFILKRRDFRVPQPAAPLPKKNRLSAAFLNFGFLSLFAVCVFRFVQQMQDILS